MRHHRKVLVIGKFRLPLSPKRKQPFRLSSVFDAVRERIQPREAAKKHKPRAAVLTLCVILALAIVPTAMVFGTGTSSPPEGNDIGNLIEITNAYFYPGSPDDGNKIPIGQDTAYENGVPIKDGDYALFFEWRLRDLTGAVANGDWFDVTIDLGLSDIHAKIKEQMGVFAPIIYLGDGKPAGTIKWTNTPNYDEQQFITLRIALSDSEFEGLIGDGTPEGCVRGTGHWGFIYTAGNNAGGNTKIVWQISVGDSGSPQVGGGTEVIPQPPGGSAGGGNETWNPYDKSEKGYSKSGHRLTPDATPAADTIFFWDIFINGHQHKTLEEWAACPNNADENPNNDDPAPPAGETFTIVDTGTGISPTWLRDVTAVDGNAVIDTQTPLLINRTAGRYGNGTDDRNAPAYLKLFYVNNEYIWQDRIDRQDSGYETPGNDKIPSHQPSPEHPVGAYDPFYTTAYLSDGRYDALLYSPNLSGEGEKYDQYLTPVPQDDIKSIILTDDGFEVEMYTEAVLGKTLAIGFMTKASTDAQGAYGQNVSNSVAIRGLEGGSVADGSARVLIGGTLSGNVLPSTNKGKFIIEKLDRGSAKPMAGVVFDIICSSSDKVLEQAANAAVSAATLITDENGKIEIVLPPLAPVWSAGLTLTVTETTPAGYVVLNPFTVTIEPESGSVILVETQAGDEKLAEVGADRYGILVWNKSIASDTNYYDVALQKFVKKVERDGGSGPETVYFRNEPNTDIPGVKNGDRILFRIDMYNKSPSYTHIAQIIDTFLPGLKFDPNATVQNPDDPQHPYNNNNWRLQEGAENTVEYIGETMNFGGQGWGGTEGIYPESRLAIIFTVDVPADTPDGTLLTNTGKITEVRDQAGNKIEDIDVPPDTAQVRLPGLIECEVDKDTIRRTSAAYESLPGGEGWNNVKNELFRYDINARSTSALEADAFNIDDPLQNVLRDQVRIAALWTPVVWGDMDGKFNIWYQTNKTDPAMVYSDVRASAVDYKAKDLPNDMAWLPNTGYKLWAQDLDTSVRKQLDISALGLAGDEYITALRFEYGAVKPGFTTKNNASASLNGEHRDADGELTDELKPLSVLGTLSGASETTASEEAEVQTEDGTAALSLSALDTLAASPSAEPVIVDWTPKAGDPFYNNDEVEGIKALTLYPISYLVEAIRPMQTEDISSTAVSRIAKKNTNDGSWISDADEDGVVTKEVVSFTLTADDGARVQVSNTYVDTIPKFAGSENPAGRSAASGAARTSDEMNPLFWIVVAAIAAAAAVILFLLYRRGLLSGFRRKGK